jgi:tRNA/tmRNA/rRNA uracil-C5-methylase (TrmA/RlmC/RlmD family)
VSHGADWQIGDSFDVEVDDIAHGGHCVARHEGRVLFVRHSAPGERVTARITGIGKGGRFVQADAVRVLRPCADRVTAPCRYAGPGGCGGCDFQHLTPAAQRRLKTAVVHEQFRRLAGLDLAAELGERVCEPLPLADATLAEGLGWRTRVELAVGSDGVPGLRRHRSREVVPVANCLIAHPSLHVEEVLAERYPDAQAVDVVGAASGTVAVQVPEHGEQEVSEQVRLPSGPGHFTLAARGFWQVHPAAAQRLVDLVMGMLQPHPGERALDLYAGVGLFAAAMADSVGPQGRVTAVESDPSAARHARANLAPWPQARSRPGRVDRVVRELARRRDRGSRRRVDLVVLDPPRVGAGRTVLGDVAALQPRALAYVSCDPASLARDTAYLAQLGWRLHDLRILDAFPMTHHVECVAHFAPVRETGDRHAHQIS